MDSRRYVLQFHYFQIHPWLPIINGVQQENKKIEMDKKGKEDKVKEDKEKSNETNVEAYNKEEKKVEEDTDTEEDVDNMEDTDNEQTAMNIVPWMENKEEHIKHDGKIKQD